MLPHYKDFLKTTFDSHAQGLGFDSTMVGGGGKTAFDPTDLFKATVLICRGWGGRGWGGGGVFF